MLKIVKQEIIGEYEHITYANGTVVKQSIHSTKVLEPIPKPTGTEIIMQSLTDAELRDLEIKQGQEILAQQMADIELAVLGGAV